MLPLPDAGGMKVMVMVDIKDRVVLKSKVKVWIFPP